MKTDQVVGATFATGVGLFLSAGRRPAIYAVRPPIPKQP